MVRINCSHRIKIEIKTPLKWLMCQACDHSLPLFHHSRTRTFLFPYSVLLQTFLLPSHFNLIFSSQHFCFNRFLFQHYCFNISRCFRRCFAVVASIVASVVVLRSSSFSSLLSPFKCLFFLYKLLIDFFFFLSSFKWY